jgi:hypothetical protein
MKTRFLNHISPRGAIVKKSGQTLQLQNSRRQNTVAFTNHLSSLGFKVKKVIF